MNILVVIPACGGPERIPRKTLRCLFGSPLLSYPIRTALGSRHPLQVWVASEDEETLNLARKLGAGAHRRAPEPPGERANLDLVVLEAYDRATAKLGRNFGLVVTMLPTAPLLTTATLDQAIDFMLAHPEVDTAISASQAPYLLWRKEGDDVTSTFPRWAGRENPSSYLRETGAFIISREANLREGCRVKGRVHLHELRNGEATDIDSQQDWATCEFLLARKRVVFVVCGSVNLGLGHVYRALAIANDLPLYDLIFLCPPGHDLAVAKFREHGYQAETFSADDWADQILAREPQITAVLGPAYRHQATPAAFPEVEFRRDCRSISELMLASDLIFAGAGGTVFEIACLGVPAIILAQNAMELTHRFASPDHGFVNLGLGLDASRPAIREAFEALAGSYPERARNSQRMLALNVRPGRRTVIDLLKRIEATQP